MTQSTDDNLGATQASPPTTPISTPTIDGRRRPVRPSTWIALIVGAAIVVAVVVGFVVLRGGGAAAAPDIVDEPVAAALEQSTPPPPELVNTGEDFDAIVRSFFARLDYMSLHDPSLEQLGEFVTPDCLCMEDYRLAAEDLIGVEFVDYPPIDVETTRVSSRISDDLVVVWVLTRRDAVTLHDPAGAVTTYEPWGPDASLVSLSLDGASGVWRIAGIERIGPSATS